LIAVADPDPGWEALGHETTEEGWTARPYLFHSKNSGRDWEQPLGLPADWHVSEGSLTRASDGALVVALRTKQEPGFPSYNDHWRRITIARSLDNGSTWLDRQVYFRSGKVHSDLITLADGRLLLTYAVRHGELDGMVYHGVEAVLSDTGGRTWQWSDRFYLFRWHMHESMHSVQSVQLADGRVFTIFFYHYDAPNHHPFSRADPQVGKTRAPSRPPHPLTHARTYSRKHSRKLLRQTCMENNHY